MNVKTQIIVNRTWNRNEKMIMCFLLAHVQQTKKIKIDNEIEGGALLLSNLLLLFSMSSLLSIFLLNKIFSLIILLLMISTLFLSIWFSLGILLMLNRVWLPISQKLLQLLVNIKKHCSTKHFSIIKNSINVMESISIKISLLTLWNLSQ